MGWWRSKCEAVAFYAKQCGKYSNGKIGFLILGICGEARILSYRVIELEKREVAKCLAVKSPAW